MDIQWYPGHMAKSRRMMQDNLRLVDILIEILDARIPGSSKNPDIDVLAKNKPRIIVLNKRDMAKEAVTNKWVEYFENMSYKVITADSISGGGVGSVYKAAASLMKDKIEGQKKRGRLVVPIRAMVAGIPNVGKSTFINKTAGRSGAKTENRPGVTRGKQWIKINADFELLDTPGILWHKFDDKEAGVKLAITGAIKDDILNTLELSWELIKILKTTDRDAIKIRYGIDYSDSLEDYEILGLIGEARGFRIKGGKVDLDRAANAILDDLRSGKLGRISLEEP